MIVKDVMAPFELYQPIQLKDAFSLLDSYGKDAWKLAGGYDSLDWFKDRVVRPKAVIYDPPAYNPGGVAQLVKAGAALVITVTPARYLEHWAELADQPAGPIVVEGVPPGPPPPYRPHP